MPLLYFRGLIPYDTFYKRKKQLLADVPPLSELRQVPDHQEVYLDKDGFTSITFDILERVGSVANDEEALKYHLEDICESEEQFRIWTSGSVKLPRLPNNTPAYTLLASQSGEQAQKPTSNIVGIVLTLARLEAQKTDVVITVNVPHIAGQEAVSMADLQTGTMGKQLDAALLYRNHILETFEICDWKLFGVEQD
ncbi:hypothetical protein MMC16_006485 [Acarospora aff. strigata]|nr:hypothetical protein [Acarospora aff. strigata]